MKIWFIASWWPTRVSPRHGNFVEKHARTVGRTHDLTVLAVQLDETLQRAEQEVSTKRHSDFLEVVVYYGCRSGSRFSKLYRRLRAYSTAIRLAHKAAGRPEVIHGHIIVDGGIVAALLGKYWGLPYFLSEHSTRYVRRIPIPATRMMLVRRACAGASAVLPVSAYLADAMARCHKISGHYRVVSNVVDSDTFSSKGRGNPASESSFRLLHVSNFREEQKNISGIIRVIQRLTAEFPGNYHLTLAGDGEHEEVRRLIRAHGLGDVEISVSGPHTEAQIASLMSDADGFVFFSHYETQGVVLLEALCVGLPCVGSRVGPVPEIIKHGVNGYLVDPGDEEGLYLSLILLRQSHSCFDRRAIRQRAVGLYGEQAVGTQIEQAYREAL